FSHLKRTLKKWYNNVVIPYENFNARFENYPVEVDVLSRFRSKKEQAETLERVRKGQIDIIIGAHRLLSKDVVFSDLGLIVIDEEHRFGVKHKETLKELKTKVDVLTLTATPIPRTLRMSMLGIRDLSVIETP
ncbi:DEAD/DEAH box helicase, partial [Streptococcus pyogenes]